MGIYNAGHLIKSRSTHQSRGWVSPIYHIEEGGMTFKRCQDYYWHIMREFELHMVASPDRYTAIKEIDRENLERMCYGASFGVHDDTIHVENWAVNEENLFHKHPEFGLVTSIDGIAELEFSVKNGACDLCGTEIPGELQFLHDMYQL